MERPIVTVLILALAMSGAGAAAAQDRPAVVTPGGGPYEMPQPLKPAEPAPQASEERQAAGGDPRAEQPAPPRADGDVRLSEEKSDKGDREDLERARAAARAAGKDDDGLVRARAAARAADPRVQGLQRARDAARRGGSGKDCLSGRQARNAISDKRAVTLAEAVRVARDSWDGEVIDYRLCTYDGALAYELTLLSPNGKVARVRVEAVNGKLVGVR